LGPSSDHVLIWILALPSVLSPEEHALCESTFDEMARAAPRLDARFRALSVVARLNTERALSLGDFLLGEHATEELVGRTFEALSGYPETLDTFYVRTRHTLFRAYVDSSRVTSLKGDAREQAIGRLVGWLRSDPNEHVRRMAVHGLISEIVSTAMRKECDYAAVFERASEMLNLVLNDPAPGVRQLAANEISSYRAYFKYLDANTLEKIERLSASVRR
jgi:hypothetical protein